MRLKLRLLAAIWLPLIVVLAGFGYVSVARERARMTTDLERRAWLLGETLKEAIEPLIDKGPQARIARIVQRFADPGRGVAVYDRSGRLVAASPEWVPREQPLPSVTEAFNAVAPQHGFRTFDNRSVYEYAVPLLADDRPRGVLAIFLDATPIQREIAELVRLQAMRFLVLV